MKAYPEPPEFAEYVAAMEHHGAERITCEVEVVVLTMLIASLQLALRHPQYPASMRPTVEDFVLAAVARLELVNPVISREMRRGMDPTQDVRCEEEDN